MVQGNNRYLVSIVYSLGMNEDTVVDTAHSSSAGGGLRTSVPVTFGVGLFTRESGHIKTRAAEEP